MGHIQAYGTPAVHTRGGPEGALPLFTSCREQSFSETGLPVLRASQYLRCLVRVNSNSSSRIGAPSPITTSTTASASFGVVSTIGSDTKQSMFGSHSPSVSISTFSNSAVTGSVKTLP